MIKGIFISWIIDKVFGGRSTVKSITKRTISRKVSQYKPKNIAKRKIRNGLKKLL